MYVYLGEKALTIAVRRQPLGLMNATLAWRGRLALLNALVPPPWPAAMLVSRLTAEEAGTLLRSVEWESYIGHPATTRVLGELAGRPVEVRRELWTPRMYGAALVARLRGGRRGGGDADVGPGDLEYIFVHYIPLL